MIQFITCIIYGHNDTLMNFWLSCELMAIKMPADGDHKKSYFSGVLFVNRSWFKKSLDRKLLQTLWSSLISWIWSSLKAVNSGWWPCRGCHKCISWCTTILGICCNWMSKKESGHRKLDTEKSLTRDYFTCCAKCTHIHLILYYTVLHSRIKICSFFNCILIVNIYNGAQTHFAFEYQ